MSSCRSERKFSNLAGLLRHAKDDNEMPLMHTGYGHAICELLDLNNSNDPSKDVENVEQCSSQSLQSEEVGSFKLAACSKLFRLFS